MDKIEITGAKEHNLRGVDVTIPRGKFVVVTGLSGSGKSSLAFDTVFAEGQRRYMETLSPYARQFIGILERPAVESITGLSPIIAIEQKTTGSNPRSTVGTITEVYDFLRLLFARAACAYSPVTGKAMVKYTGEQITRLILGEYGGQKCLLLAPLVVGRKGHYKELFDNLLRKGYQQVRVDGEIMQVADMNPLDRYKVHFIELVVDKLIPSESDYKRIYDSVSNALERGKGTVAVLRQEDAARERTTLGNRSVNDPGRDLRFFSKHLMDPQTGMSLPEPAPFTFSFNSPQGACPHCKGLGYVSKVDMERIIPDPSKSIAAGGIAPLGKYRNTDPFRILESMARKYDFSLNTPFAELPEDIRHMIIYGSEELFRVNLSDGTLLAAFPGVIAKYTENGEDNEDTASKKNRGRENYIENVVCPECGGTRLRKEALYFRIGDKTIAEVADMDIDTLCDFFATLPEKLDKRQNRIARDILKELADRVGFLKAVGLDYLSLSRSTASLSGGESQRIRLATQIGSKLVNVLYILDEPSIGLHQRDNVKLIDSLKKLRDEGNSVMVVEHDMETMMSADWLIDLGPGAGSKGGKLLYNGNPEELMKMSESRIKSLGSLTAEYLKGIRKIEVPSVRRKGNGLTLSLFGATGNNLRGVDLKIPLGCLVGISGVSGSGKSSLINETLRPVLGNRFYRSAERPLPYGRIEGIENIDKVIVVDQTPIGRSPRSNPATYTNLFTDIRKLFEKSPDAQIRGFRQGRFSFNVKGGRCETCKGAGVETIEMNYLPSVYVTCKECNGKRYNAETLEVKYKGKNISEVLEMTISEAALFFEHIPAILPKLKALEDVGLGYIKLGQPSTTLSGGESQRVKLAAELARKETGSSLFILDEPTTGLHFHDIKVLLGVLDKLVEKGNTIVIIEHNLDVLKSVDYLIDMGPEGGRGGGMIIAEGTPEQVARCGESYTGKFLGPLLGAD